MKRTLIAAALLVASFSPACASYQGSARDVSADQVSAERGWLRINNVPLVRQQDAKDCGAAALSAVLRFWRPEDLSYAAREQIDVALRRSASEGLAAGALRDYARQHGFSAFVFEGALDDLRHELMSQRPVIVGVYKPLSSGEALAHYEVVLGYHAARQQVLTFDPSSGLQTNSVRGFLAEWTPAGKVTLVVLPEAVDRRLAQ